VAVVAGLAAHGGTAGAIGEGAIALGVAALFLAVWLRERRRGGDDNESDD
jgi:hypothetical protein